MVLTPSRIAAEALRFLPRKSISRAVGRIAAAPASSAVVDRAIAAFVRAYDVDVSEAVVPEGGYATFNDFFTRRLVPGARPLPDDPRALVSPADGRVDDLGPVDLAATITIKGKLYDVADLLGDAESARRYDGGSYFIVYLSPRDYHRVHTPVTGRVSEMRYVPGTLYPVNAIGTAHVPRVFARNERVAVVQQSAIHDEVTSIMVGAIGVGRIGLVFDDVQTNVGVEGCVRHYGGSGPSLDRGDELGVFNLGSTVIVFATKKADLTFRVAPGATVRMGQTIAIGGAP